MLRAFVDRPNVEAATPPRRIEMVGATHTYSWDFGPLADKTGETVSSVAAESSNTGAVSIGTDAVASDVWSAPISAVAEGTARITLTATMSGDTIAVRHFTVRVLDPDENDESTTW